MMKKKIAIYGFQFPEGMAMTNRLKLYMRSLSLEGIRPDVISLGRLYKKGDWEGVKYEQWVKCRMLHPSLDVLLPSFLDFINIHKLTKHYDTIFIGRYGWFSLLVIALICRWNNTELLLELNENPESPGGSRLKPEFVRRINRQLILNLSFKYVDGFICISTTLEKLVRSYNKKAKIVVVPILCEINTQEVKSLSTQDHPYIFHAGCIDPQKDGIFAVIEGFAKACCMQQETNIRFYFTVKSAHPKVLNHIDAIIKKYDVSDRVEWLGFLPFEKVKNYRDNATLGIVHKPKNWQNDYNFPTKLGDLLSSGIPVIATKSGEMGLFLKDGFNAYLVNDNDSDQIASAILEILNDPAKANYIGQNAQELALKSFDYKNYSSLLANFFLG